jgi:hypothetical protein
MTFSPPFQYLSTSFSPPFQLGKPLQSPANKGLCAQPFHFSRKR